MIRARRLVVVVNAGKCTFGAMVPKHLILLGRKAGLPFGIGKNKFFHYAKMARTVARFNPRSALRAQNFAQ